MLLNLPYVFIEFKNPIFIQLFLRINSMYNFKYLLKTDDDCFIDLHFVIDFLAKIKNDRQIWWGK